MSGRRFTGKVAIWALAPSGALDLVLRAMDLLGGPDGDDGRDPFVARPELVGSSTAVVGRMSGDLVRT